MCHAGASHASETGTMPDTIQLDGPTNLATLDAFLASDRTPPDCMQLSELDGFLAGIVVGPEDDSAERVVADGLARRRTHLCRPPGSADGPRHHHAPL